MSQFIHVAHWEMVPVGQAATSINEPDVSLDRSPRPSRAVSQKHGTKIVAGPATQRTASADEKYRAATPARPEPPRQGIKSVLDFMIIGGLAIGLMVGCVASALAMIASSLELQGLYAKAIAYVVPGFSVAAFCFGAGLMTLLFSDEP